MYLKFYLQSQDQVRVLHEHFTNMSYTVNQIYLDVDDYTCFVILDEEQIDKALFKKYQFESVFDLNLKPSPSGNICRYDTDSGEIDESDRYEFFDEKDLVLGDQSFDAVLENLQHVGGVSFRYEFERQYYERCFMTIAQKDYDQIEVEVKPQRISRVSYSVEERRENGILRQVRVENQVPYFVYKIDHKIDSGKYAITVSCENSREEVDLRRDSDSDVEQQDDSRADIVYMESFTINSPKDIVEKIRNAKLFLRGNSAALTADQNAVLKEKFENFIKFSFSRGKDLFSALCKVSTVIEQLCSVSLDNLPLKTFVFGPKEKLEPLSILSLREQIINNLKPKLMITSATGSGKTLVGPLYLQEDKSECKLTFLTQPNQNLANINSQVMRDVLGDSEQIQITTDLKQIGHSKKKLSIVCTAHTLLRYLIENKDIIRKSRFILDEFHERRAISDFLYAFIAKEQENLNQPNQLVLMSATMNPKLQRLFRTKGLVTEAQSVTNFEIETIEVQVQNSKKAFTDSPLNIINKEIKQFSDDISSLGHFLVFQPGVMACETFYKLVVDSFKENSKFNLLSVIDYESKYRDISQTPDKLYLLPIIYNGKSTQLDQKLVTTLVPKNVIKIVIATAKAQTGITIVDLVVVIDTGIQNEKVYITESDITSLTEVSVPQETHVQRKGRVGRTRPGKIYKIVSKDQKQNDIVPEVEKTDLSKLILEYLKFQFDIQIYNKYLPDPIENQKLESLYKELFEIAAITSVDNCILLNQYGLDLLQFTGFSPRLSHVLLQTQRQKSNITTQSKQSEYALIIGIMFAISAEPYLISDSYEIRNQNNEMGEVIDVFLRGNWNLSFKNDSLKIVKQLIFQAAEVIEFPQITQPIEGWKFGEKFQAVKSLLIKFVDTNPNYLENCVKIIKVFNAKFVEIRTCTFDGLKKLNFVNNGQRVSYKSWNIDNKLEYCCFQRLGTSKQIEKQFIAHQNVMFFGISLSKKNQYYCQYYYKINQPNNTQTLYYAKISDPWIQQRTSLQLLNLLIEGQSKRQVGEKAKSAQLQQVLETDWYIYENNQDLNASQNMVISKAVEFLLLNGKIQYCVRNCQNYRYAISYDMQSACKFQITGNFRTYTLNPESIQSIGSGYQLCLDFEKDKLALIAVKPGDKLKFYNIDPAIPRQQVYANKQFIQKDSFRDYLSKGMFEEVQVKNQQIGFAFTKSQVLTSLGRAVIQLDETLEAILREFENNRRTNLSKYLQIKFAAKDDRLGKFEGCAFNHNILPGATVVYKMPDYVKYKLNREMQLVTTIQLAIKIILYTDDDFEIQEQILTNVLEQFMPFVISETVYQDSESKQILVFFMGNEVATQFCLQYAYVKNKEQKYKVNSCYYNKLFAQNTVIKREFLAHCNSLNVEFQEKEFSVKGQFQNIYQFIKQPFDRYTKVNLCAISSQELVQQLQQRQICVIIAQKDCIVVEKQNYGLVAEFVYSSIVNSSFQRTPYCFCSDPLWSKRKVQIGGLYNSICERCYRDYFGVLALPKQYQQPHFVNLGSLSYSLPEFIDTLSEISREMVRQWLDNVFYYGKESGALQFYDPSARDTPPAPRIRQFQPRLHGSNWM